MKHVLDLTNLDMSRRMVGERRMPLLPSFSMECVAVEGSIGYTIMTPFGGDSLSQDVCDAFKNIEAHSSLPISDAIRISHHSYRHCKLNG